MPSRADHARPMWWRNGSWSGSTRHFHLPTPLLGVGRGSSLKFTLLLHVYSSLLYGLMLPAQRRTRRARLGARSRGGARSNTRQGHCKPMYRCTCRSQHVWHGMGRSVRPLTLYTLVQPTISFDVRRSMYAHGNGAAFCALPEMSLGCCFKPFSLQQLRELAIDPLGHIQRASLVCWFK